MIPSLVSGRKWRDTGTGTIVFEEAWTIPELAFQTGYVALRTVAPALLTVMFDSNTTTGQCEPLN